MFHDPISTSLLSQECVVQRQHSEQEGFTLKESCCLHHFIQIKSDAIKRGFEGEKISQIGGFSLHGVGLQAHLPVVTEESLADKQLSFDSFSSPPPSLSH